jgi:hypothetical protein
VHPSTYAVGWKPLSAGVRTIGLALDLPSGVTVDTYTFTVTVIDVGQADIVAHASVTPSVGLAPLPVVLDAAESTGTGGRPILQPAGAGRAHGAAHLHPGGRLSCHPAGARPPGLRGRGCAAGPGLHPHQHAAAGAHCREHAARGGALDGGAAATATSLPRPPPATPSRSRTPASVSGSPSRTTAGSCPTTASTSSPRRRSVSRRGCASWRCRRTDRRRSWWGCWPTWKTRTASRWHSPGPCRGG